MTPDELKTRRKALGYGPVDFARVVGVQYQTVWTWESGRRQIPSMLERLLECLESNYNEEES